ncbi:uncharacterized protein LOC111787096 [Cucurbita pepo subsp. pepo]|uniref:uncharacterized protein LOC111787096 n=1 Tax=Cucurbita pepo subsp. pepo TaxID=3664 RepID=UPI000C9D2D7E|nr:uncharacterized protein LOC111787096 [Cucurbita pepo subsp. pepo]
MDEDVISPPVDTTMNVEGTVGNEDILNMRLDEDNVPQSFPGVEVLDPMDVQDCGPSNQRMREDDNLSQNVPEIEVLREAVPDLSPRDVPMVPSLGGDHMSESHRLVDENISEENLLPIMEDKMTLPRTSLPFEQSAGLPTSATSQEALDMIDTHISFSKFSSNYSIF